MPTMTIDTPLAVAEPLPVLAALPLERGDLVWTPDGFQARVVWLFVNCGDICAHVRRLGGYPGSFPVRNLRRVK